MKPDGDTIFAIVVLLVPVLALGFWHKFEWGATFGPASGLWSTSSVTAAILIVCLVAVTAYLGADEIWSVVGGRRRRGELLFYLMPGAGLATAIFPGPASEVAGKYKELAMENATRTFSAVGWSLFGLWVLLVVFYALV